MRTIFCTLSTLAMGCTRSEQMSDDETIERFLKDATEYQVPCAQLEEGKHVPKNIQLGACKNGTTMLLTLHRECPNNKSIHNNAMGWWNDENIFHKGEAPLELIVHCSWK